MRGGAGGSRHCKGVYSCSVSPEQPSLQYESFEAGQMKPKLLWTDPDF